MLKKEFRRHSPRSFSHSPSWPLARRLGNGG